MTAKSRKVWMSNSFADGYEIFPLARRPSVHGRICIQRNSLGNDTGIQICSEHLMRLFPRLKLKVGEPPRRVEITMEFCD